MTNDERLLYLKTGHPFDRKGVDQDAYIDLFRNVFIENPQGIHVLTFLAGAWGFFDRSIPTEERRTQRQCFVDILRCCGVTDETTVYQLMQTLVWQPYEKRNKVKRLFDWMKGLNGIRVRRQNKPVQQENTEQGRATK